MEAHLAQPKNIKSSGPLALKDILFSRPSLCKRSIAQIIGEQQAHQKAFKWACCVVSNSAEDIYINE